VDREAADQHVVVPRAAAPGALASRAAAPGSARGAVSGRRPSPRGV